MVSLPLCPGCRQAVPPDAPAGLCPECLFTGGLPANAAHGRDLPISDPALARTTPAGASPSFAVPAASDLARLFPHLEIQALVGQGGMGAVYRARQVRLDRLVALKIIRPESAEDPAFAERFNREARTLARMSHPHIVAVHDFGDVDLPSASGAESTGTRLYYFVMEYVDGANLRQLCGGGVLPADQASAIAAQVCEALQYAHDEGVVHRDIKPENILITQRGRVKIADFGLARLVAGSRDNFTLTGTHQVMGTPRYMAPEQMAGSRDVDHRADIYSLGVVFYEMLTGTLPLGSFDRPSVKANSVVELDQIVLTALATDPDRRYQHVSQFAHALHAVTAGRINSLDISGQMVQSWPGPSTILDNAVGGVVNRVRDGWFLRLLTHPHSPAIAAVLLAIAHTVVACLTVVASRRLRREEGSEWATPLTAIETPAAVIGLSALGAILVLFTAGASAAFRKWRPLSIFVSGGIATVCMVEGFNRIHGNYHSMSGEWQADLWFLTSTCLTVATLLAAAWDQRNALHTSAGSHQRVQPETWRSSSGFHQMERRAHWQPIPARDAHLPDSSPWTQPASSAERNPDRQISEPGHSAGVPRTSRRAIAGFWWAILFFLVALPAALLGWSALAMLLPILMAPVGTTLLGWLAIGDIRRSQGMITGFGLAFFDAVVFPVLVLNGAFLAFLQAVIPPQPVALLVVLLVVIDVLVVSIDVVLLRWLWRKLRPGISGSAVERDGVQSSPISKSDSAAVRRETARDSVSLSIEEVLRGELPDVCMACGTPTVQRVSWEFSHQSELAQILTFIGIVCGFFPGLIIASVTTRKLRVAGPMCDRHVNHWTQLIWFASTGWLMMLVLGGIGAGIGRLVNSPNSPSTVIGAVIGAVIGLVAYLIPLNMLATTRITTSSLDRDHIELSRVSSAFAAAVRKQRNKVPGDHDAEAAAAPSDVSSRANLLRDTGQGLKQMLRDLCDRL